MTPESAVACAARHAALCDAIRDEAWRLRRADPHSAETGCRLAALDALEAELDEIATTLALQEHVR